MRLDGRSRPRKPTASGMATHGQPGSSRLAAEWLGSLLLAAAVIGSGVMAERLAAGNTAVALLANTGATVAVLATLIALLGPISGAHFNPAVSLVQAMRGALSWREAAAFALVQVIGCCLGAVLAHAMFDLPILQSSLHVRSGAAQWSAEAVATFGLIPVILGHSRREQAAWMVWPLPPPRHSYLAVIDIDLGSRIGRPVWNTMDTCVPGSYGFREWQRSRPR
jgi:glycerol uptake facilitator-like aquaporin